MSRPFIFIATNRLKTARLEDEKKRVAGLAEFIEANEPRLIAFNEYSNEDGTEVGVVQVHPDTDSMEFHMEAVRERAERAYAETLDSTTSIQVYGTPTQTIFDMLSRTAGSGVPVTVKPHHLGGFSHRDDILRRSGRRSNIELGRQQ
jgi:UTP-glucose-1-phosphate uridylyltransferase